jgi:hypothetical protein
VPHVPFVDVAAEAGIRFVHQTGKQEDVLFPETMGGGVAVLDYNTDGRPDLLFINETYWPGTPEAASAAEFPLPALYRNDGGWRFTDVTHEAGLAFSFYGMGAAVGDYDNDGDPDLFLTAVGPCRLLENDEGVFRDVTAIAGVAGDPNAWSTSAGWFDYDLDGDLDLLVCNYVRWSRQMNFDRAFRPQEGMRGSLSPRSFDGDVLKLYRNEGGGLFSDVSRTSGIEFLAGDDEPVAAKALGVVFTDLNGDEWPDVVVANDSVRNFAYLNQRDGTFVERGQQLNVAYGPDGKARGGMGIDAADFRNDGTLGIAIGNFSKEMTALFTTSRSSRGIFSDEAVAVGIGAETLPLLTFGVFFFDYDLDGRLDLLHANGHVEPDIAASDAKQTFEQQAQLFWNRGAGADTDFVAVAAKDSGADLFRPLVGRGAAYGDFDGDGDLDVVLAGINSLPRLLKNEQQLGHHWLRLTLVGSAANRDAIGARVEIHIDGKWLRQTVSPTKSYLSQCEKTLTFGLGAAEGIASAQIVWPGGQVQPLQDLSLDCHSIIEQDRLQLPPSNIESSK